MPPSAPERLATFRPCGYLLLECGWSEAEPVFVLLEYEGTPFADRTLLEPAQQLLVRIVAGGNQDVHCQAAPDRAAGEDDDAAAVGTHPFRQPAVPFGPATEEDAARLLRSFIVNGAVVSRAVGAGLAQLDGVPQYAGLDPPFTTERAVAAGPDLPCAGFGFCRVVRFAAAMFELPAAATGAGVVASGSVRPVHLLSHAVFSREWPKIVLADAKVAKKADRTRRCGYYRGTVVETPYLSVITAIMKTIQLDLGEHSYPIFIGTDLLGRADLVRPSVRGHQVLIVSNETVAPLYLEQAAAAFRDYHCDWVILPDGEQYKTLQTLNVIFDALLERQFDRKCTLVALGGGVVGDITGFAAACYQRGVDFIQIPTTLLAQVDSSVGGKTGVNHPLGKNMIGAFHQPRCVIADIGVLDTLDDRQLSAGLAEVIKYGLIQDAEFFAWLEENMDRLLAREPAALIHAIHRSCEDKAKVVAADERESGLRAILNMGHTFGHAIETGVGYGRWLHGEAVATGMLMAADLSHRLGWLSAEDVARIDNLIDKACLPTRAPADLECDRFLELMAVDKKVSGGKIHLVLPKAIGEAVVCGDYDPALLRETLEAHLAVGCGSA